MKRKRRRTLRGSDKGAMNSVPIAESSIITIDAPTNDVQRSSVRLLFGLIERSLRNLWTNYYPPGAFGEDEQLMPGSDLNFIIIGLLAFVGIKAQGITGFPFKTNPRTTMVSVTSLIMFALASTAKRVFSPTPTSIIYTIVARFGRMVSLNQGAKDSEISTATYPFADDCGSCIPLQNTYDY